ncbi:MAG: glycosyltransferase, partial [Nitrospirae bacterium]|nr:glycosyltransferase [Nitrospirota bacterium]
MLTIGIPVRGSLDSLKITVNSVLENTRCPVEILFVDDYSEEDTRSYLRSFGNVIRNSSVKGFPYNCNLIMKSAKYDNICL